MKLSEEQLAEYRKGAEEWARTQGLTGEHLNAFIEGSLNSLAAFVSVEASNFLFDWWQDHTVKSGRVVEDEDGGKE